MYRNSSGKLIWILLAVVTISWTFMTHMVNAYLNPSQGILVEGLKFSKPCPEEGYRYHNRTGNFLCVVHTAKECFELCQQMRCNEWYFLSMMSSRSEQINKYYRCRCIPEYHMCFYNHVPKRYRDFS